MLDVLADLAAFARANRMTVLADRLDETRIIASSALAGPGTEPRGEDKHPEAAEKTHRRQM